MARARAGSQGAGDMLSRRAFALGSAALLGGCRSGGDASATASRGPSSSAAPPLESLPAAAAPRAVSTSGPRGSTQLLEWNFDAEVSTRTVVVVPAWDGAPARFPVLVALHGRGEAKKSPALGALGWPRDYALVRAFDRVSNPPLRSEDFEGFVDAVRLDAANRALAARPFGALIVACPYVPDLDLADEDAVAAFGQFVTSVLLPRVRRETAALASASATGIDGVSLGGAVALAVGLEAASHFGAVGTLQPALDAHDTAHWTERAVAARRANPALALRLLTSDGDYFRDAVRATSSAFRAAGLDHDFDQELGPHDYPWNRGPGAIAMLTWHDRVLRRRL